MTMCGGWDLNPNIHILINQKNELLLASWLNPRLHYIVICVSNILSSCIKHCVYVCTVYHLLGWHPDTVVRI